LLTAAKFHEKFVQQRGDDPQQKADLGRAYYRLGRLTGQIGDRDKCIELLRKSLAMFKDLTAAEPNSADYQNELASAHSSLAGWLEGTNKHPEAADSYHQAQAIWESLNKTYPGNPSTP
jgi:tetratricopeptide (TPR) repeat protein